jgi:mycothiol synthase
LVTIRNFHLHDLTAYVQLVNEIDEVDGLDRATSVEQLKQRLGQPGYRAEEDLFLAEVDGLLVGYADMVREMEIGRVILDIAVHPTHRGRGIGSRLLEIAIDNSRKLGAKVVQIPIAKGIQASEYFVQKRGFRVVRRQWQMSLIEYGVGALQIPRGFELRQFLPGDEGSLCALQNLAFTGSWGFRPNTVEEIRYKMSTNLCRPDVVVFINKSQRKVGYCWTMDHPTNMEKGWIRMMGVNPTYRGRGLGRAILVAGIEHLRKRGIKEIELLVDSRNQSAKRLYRSVGFKRKGITLWYQRNPGS